MQTELETITSTTSTNGDIIDTFGLTTTETIKLELYITGDQEYITMLMFVETVKSKTSTDGDNTDSTGQTTIETMLSVTKEIGSTNTFTGQTTTEIIKLEIFQDGDKMLSHIINIKSTESMHGETQELDNYINTSKDTSMLHTIKSDIGITFQEQLQEELEEDTQLITQEELLLTIGFTSIITNK